ncbi:uncharacterized protein LOC120790182 [Xiphias gladius]|uniref:uncharacterized protein LOC120790182 n=1 Tax=Xiphias gladius TaxID=8245 RepID=UPI001A9815F8|nr:uncharacterized protein LOC120790182 [Xiphias gladius]
MDSSDTRDLAAENGGLACREEPSNGGRSVLLMCLTYIPERYRTAKFSLGAYLLCWALFRWYKNLRCRPAPLQPQEAIEDFPHLSEGLSLQEGDLGADSVERCERSIGGGDTSDEYFDSCSWHSDTLSDLTPDGEDCLVALFGLEDAYNGHQATGSSFCTAQSRKSPENNPDPNIPLKLSTRDLCSVEIQLHPNSEREELTGRELDPKQPQSARLQPLLVQGRTLDLILNHWDQGGATIDTPFCRQLHSVDQLLERAQSGSIDPGPDSSQIQYDIGKGSEECLPPHPFLNNLLFLPGNQGAEETSPLLSEKFRGQREGLGSPCSLLRQTKEWEGEGSYGYLDQEQTVEAISKVSLPQSQLGTTELSEHRELRVIPKAITRDLDAYFFPEHLPSKIGETSTHPAATESIQNSSGEHPSAARRAISQSNIQSTFHTVSSHYKQIQMDLKIPEPLCSQKTSLSLLSDSNNNTKASIKGVQRGEVVGCFSGGPQSNYKDNENIIRPQEDSEVSLSSLDHRFNESSEESVLGKDFDSHFHLNLVHADELEKLKTEKSTEDNTVVESLELKCANSEKNEGLKPLRSQVDSELKEDKQPGDHSLPNRRRGSLSESLEEYTLAEKCREHTQVSLLAPQQEVRIVRYSNPDVSVSLLAVRSLEPIWEAERSLENCGTTEDNLKIETKKEYEIMRPADKVQTEQKEKYLTTAELEPGVNTSTPVLCTGSEKHCRPMTVAYDAVCYTSASSNCDELEHPHFAISYRDASLQKMIKRSKAKGSQTGNRSSKFSVFAKMPSFRKAKGSKCSKSEEVLQESSDGGGEGPMPEQGPKKNNSDDEVFVRGDILNQTVHQAFSPVRQEIKEEDCFLPSIPDTRLARHLVSQGSSEVGSRGSCPDNPLLRQVQSPNGQTCKKSKTNDNLNICMRFAQAHKSLSSLFESRLMDKENEEQATVGIDVDYGKSKQSWRKLKKAKEAELLKRTLSVPDGECSDTAFGQDCGHVMSSPLLDRLSNPGSPSSLRSLCHTDPITKRGVPQGGGKESPHGCKSEGQRRKYSPNGLPTTLRGSGLPPFLEASAVSPLSPSSLATLTHQHSPFWTRSQPVANDGLTDSPLRPMSPKPNSPRPAAQRKIFRCPHSSRCRSVCRILLGQSVSVEGLMDPPERPKALKPSTSPLDVSLSLLDGAEHRIDSQSHIGLYAIGFISGLEGTQNSGQPASQSRTRKLLEVEIEGKASVVLGGHRTGCWVDVGHDGGGQQRRQNCSDDLWIEEQKKYKRKLARAIRGSLGQINTLISEERDKTDTGVTSGPKAFRGMPLKANCFSQSTPIGLDCLGWRRRIPYACQSFRL